jgi:hypothetical protein
MSLDLLIPFAYLVVYSLILQVTKGLKRVILDLKITFLPTCFPHKNLCSYLSISSNTLGTFYAFE